MFRYIAKNPPVQLIFMIFFVHFAGHLFSLQAVHFFYSLSIILKDLLLWGLPLVIAVFIAITLQSFEKKAIFFVFFLMIFEALSNSSSVLFAYGVGCFCENIVSIPSVPLNATFKLVPLIDLAFYKPAFWSVDKAVLGGVILGVWGSVFVKNSFLNQPLLWLKDKVTFWFLGIFITLIPLYVFGFLLYMKASGLFTHIINHYSVALCVLGAALAVYLLFIMALSAGFKAHKFRTIFSVLFPTGLVAFTSMSSAATMPFTIKAAEKILKNPSLAGIIIPATTNIQQVGDCLANALLCLIILKTTGGGLPGFFEWMAFTVVFVLARFTTVGTMGGAIFIMIPIYERYLGFTPEMSSLMIALNVVLDPLITAVNVVANGALCVLIEKIWVILNRNKIDPVRLV